MAMYANLLEENVGEVMVESDSLSNNTDKVAIIDVLATVDKNGENWSVSIVNRHPTDTISSMLEFGNKPLNGNFKATILTGDSPDAYNDIDNPYQIIPKEITLLFNKGVVQLPPHSLVIVEIKGKSK